MQGAQRIMDAFHACSSEGAEIVEEVYERNSPGCREALALKLTTKVLLFSADPADDTITVNCESAAAFGFAGLERAASAVLRSLVGRTFFWGWATVNQQGYSDGVMLSFDHLYPAVLVNVIASSLAVFSVTEEQLPARDRQAVSITTDGSRPLSVA